MTQGQQTRRSRAQFNVDEEQESTSIDDRLFGSFVEHLGRGIYSGIYEPGHPTADEQGFRGDVMNLVKELGVTTIRYPGGNFVSGYRWEDGVGPRESRPRRLDLAWHSSENNEFGLHEMSDWLDKLGGNELMEAVNLGTRGMQEALDLLEYCNVPSGTELSERRRANGHDRPFDIRMWCLGNEMDGDWQIGHKSAQEYADLANRTAVAMRMIDPGLDLVVCGSSSHTMPTFGLWERTVLERCFDNVNFLSCHAYYAPKDGDMASFLASGVDMDSFITDVTAIIAASRARLGSDHQVFISFDEWNVWYQDEKASKSPEGIGNWPLGAPLLEDVYSVADAVVVGDLLITLLRHADVVHAASLAQLVNVIAPIMTEPGGPAWRQTIFYPFALTARYARGARVLKSVQSGDTYETSRYGQVPMTDSVAVRGADGSLSVFAVNRSLERAVDLSIVLPEQDRHRKVAISTLHEDDPSARNTLEHQERVVMHARQDFKMEENVINLRLPPVSWTLIHLA